VIWARILLAVLLASVASGAFHQTTRVAAADCRIAWGMFIEGTPPNMEQLRTQERRLHHHAEIVHWFHSWDPKEDAFDASWLKLVWDHGSMPFISWEPEDIPLRDLIGGKRDPYIDSWAKGMAAWGKPVMLAPMIEADVFHHSYSIGVNGNTESDFISAWRHIHQRFQLAKAANVIWVWDMGGHDPDSGVLEKLYPGDAYVDWLAVNPYNWTTVMKPPQPWQELADIVAPLYDHLQKISPSKPIMLGEWGSSRFGGDRARWLQNAGRDLPRRFPKLKAVVYFDESDWYLDSYPRDMEAARKAFGEGTPFCMTFDGVPPPPAQETSGSAAAPSESEEQPPSPPWPLIGAAVVLVALLAGVAGLIAARRRR
jgi:hypothetical protein